MGLVCGSGTLHPSDDGALERAKDDYVSGKIEIDDFERAIAAILDGTDRWYTSPFAFVVERRK